MRFDGRHVSWLLGEADSAALEVELREGQTRDNTMII